MFKDPLHDLLKKIEHETYFTYPADDIPCPKPKDNKYRCSYHAKRGHLTTWCPQFKEYLQDLVRKGHFSQYIDQEKTKKRQESRKHRALEARQERDPVATLSPELSM